MKVLNLCAAVLAGVMLAACAPRSSGPALWRLADADSEIWLLGTVHVLSPGVKWRTARIEQAFDAAETVWFEAPTDEAAVAEIGALVAQLGANPPGVTLTSLLNAEENARYARVAKSLGVETASLEAARPWIAALQLSLALLTRQGADPNSGVETALEADAARRGKKMAYFESAALQMHIFADLPPAAEKRFFLATLRQIEEEADTTDEMDRLWANGRVDELGKLLQRQIDEAGPEVADALIHKRNAAWTAEIDAMMAGKGRVFIAVGTAHLTGPRGVPALLRAKGYAVEGP
ncbi:MAG: TraB/GumN family protein [Hyphomonadaceae bacterium]|nr:TraB/GumN family protein [Hyphomonadaceae bacterium]